MKIYSLDKNIVTISDGKFKGLQFTISDFEESNGKLKYNYKIISGEVQVNEGELFKDLIKLVVDDIIFDYNSNKELNE